MAGQQYPEPTVGALIFSPEGKLFLMKSHKWRHRYVVPGGHIELGERMEDALRREIKEETGLDIYDVKFLCLQEFVYDDAFWKRRHFIFFDYTCRTDSTEARLNSEAQEYVWVSLGDALRLPLDPYTERAIQEYLNRYPVRKVESTLTVPSIEETAAWYERVLGWVGHYDVFDAEGHCLFGSVMCGDLESVMQGKETFRGFNLSRFSEGAASYSQGCANFSALIFVDDVEAVYARAVDNEAAVDCAPEDQLWGGRTFSMQDLNGFRLTFVQMVESVTLEEIRQRHLARGQ